MKETINVSTKTIIKLVLVGLAIYFLFVVRDVLGVVFTAWVFSSALHPAVDKLAHYKIPRVVSILCIYLIIIGVVVLVGYALVPPVGEQIQSIASSFPSYYNRVTEMFSHNESLNQYGLSSSIQNGLESISTYFSNLTGGLFEAVLGVAGGLLWLVGIFVITFYLTIEQDGMKKLIQSLAPLDYQPYMIRKINHIQQKLGSWLWGQLILMLIIAVLTYIGLLLLGVKYALVLAILAGILEFVPYIGPILAAVPAMFFAVSGGWIQVVLVLILFIVIQQSENQIIVPKVMQKAVGINPVITIIALLLGAKIGGVIGIILSIPAVIIISIFFEDFLNEKKSEESKLE